MSEKIKEFNACRQLMNERLLSAEHNKIIKRDHSDTAYTPGS